MEVRVGGGHVEGRTQPELDLGHLSLAMPVEEGP